LKGSIERPFPEVMLLIECDDNVRTQKKTARKITKILERHKVNYKTLAEEKDREMISKIRDAAAVVMAHSEGEAKALPVIGGGVVPADKFKEYVEGLRAMLKANNLKPAIWGHAGDVALFAQPCLDLSQVGDRQKVFKLQDEYAKLVISLGGNICAYQSDGRLFAPQMPLQFGKEIYELFAKVKEIFDPYKILNPGVKSEVTTDDVKPLLRYEYSMDRLYDYLPRG
jgi:FAD/FMN-containing dehydrogenase